MDKNIIIRLLKTNQRLKAFNLGNIISDEHNIKGNNILPNPPINIDIIIEDVINIPWKVILELYWRGEHSINPGKANSELIQRLTKINILRIDKKTHANKG